MDTQKTAIKSRPASAYRPFRWVRNFKKRWVNSPLSAPRSEMKMEQYCRLQCLLNQGFDCFADRDLRKQWERAYAIDVAVMWLGAIDRK